MVQLLAMIGPIKTAVAMIPKSLWVTVGGVVIVVAGWFYVNSLKSTIAEQQQTIATERATNKVLKTQNETLQASYNVISKSLSTQNDFIQRLGLNMEFLTKDMTILTNNVERKMGDLGQQLGTLYKKDMSSLSCDQAIQEMRSHAKKVK